MTIDLSEVIHKLKTLQDKFNVSKDPVERLAILSTINHIGRNELPFDEKEWVYKQYHDATLRKYGANIKEK